jgi:glucosamine-6-phosphate deaminase
MTHFGELENDTRTHLMEYFDEKINVPYRVITMGIKSILKARKIIVIAVGSAKAAPVSKLFEYKYSTLWPVTSLIFHNDVTLFADIDACRLMQK